MANSIKLGAGALALILSAAFAAEARQIQAPNMSAKTGDKIAAAMSAEAERRLESDEAKIARLEAKIAAYDARFAALDSKTQGMVGGINQANNGLDKLKARFDSHTHTFQKTTVKWDSMSVVANALSNRPQEMVSVGSVKDETIVPAQTSTPN